MSLLSLDALSICFFESCTEIRHNLESIVIPIETQVIGAVAIAKGLKVLTVGMIPRNGSRLFSV